jgi:periplasmic protein TonB
MTVRPPPRAHVDRGMSTMRPVIPQRSGGSIAPVWQRPLACCIVVLAHAAIILAVTWPDFNVNVPVHLQINIVAQGEPARSLSAVDSQSTQEVKSVSQQLHETNPEFKPESADTTEIPTKEPIETPTREPDLPEAKAARPPERQRLDAAVVSEQAQSRDLAQVPSPDAVHGPVSGGVVSAPAPLTEAKEAQEPDLTKASTAEELPEVKVASDAVETVAVAAPANVPPDVDRPKAQRAEPERREKAPEIHKRPRHAALEPQTASRTGMPSTRGSAGAATGAVSTATYRSLVIAELSRHKQYPPAALSAGVQGTVVVAFTIGASGRVVAHTITRSSGSSALDGAVHRMMAAVSLPPPPGGIYRATAPVEFVLHR